VSNGAKIMSVRTNVSFVQSVATLKVVPSLKPNDGHNVFDLPAGRQHWLAALDPFLRAQNLPTWTPQQVDALMQRYRRTRLLKRTSDRHATGN
jgi:hypothetical protein